MKRFLKKLAARLPVRWQQGLKRRYFGRQIRRNAFGITEPDFALLPELVSPGDWVIDVGANVGHYALRLSDLVGESGRVIAFEPVPETFELLASNAALARWKNLTLLQAAAAESSGVASMTIPRFADSGLSDYYSAQLSEADGALRVCCLSVDSLGLPHPVRLVKIDAEGHELSVLLGMRGLLERDRPVLIVEGDDPDVGSLLEEFGYGSVCIDESANLVYRPRAEVALPG